MKRILSYLKKYQLLIIISFIFSIIAVCCDLLIPFYSGKIIDTIILFNNLSSIKNYLLMIFIFAILLAFFQYLITLINQKIAYELSEKIRNEFIKKIQKLPLSFLDKQKTGDLISRCFNDVESFTDGLLMGFSSLFSSSLSIVIILLIMVKLNYLICLIVVLLTPLSIFVSNYIAKSIDKYLKKQSEIKGKETALIVDLINNQKTIKLFNYQKKSYQELKDINDEFKEISTKATFYSSLTNPSVRLVNNIIYACIAIACFILKQKYDVMTIGEITIFLSYVSKYAKPFNEIATSYTSIKSAIVSFERADEIINEKEEETKQQYQKIDVIESIEFKNVYFSYDHKNYVIEDFNLKVDRKEKTAICGKTGSGKTTLMNLLLRYYEVDKGEILINGINIQEISKENLRQLIGLVLQDTYLKEDTIENNIAYGKDCFKDIEVIKAAQKAHADKFINKLPQGYQTKIKENGTNISLGERQLICLARVFMMEPQVLVLDEATSSLDTKTELDVNKGLDELMKNKMCFVVAHRLSTIESADRIVYLENGKIIEEGNHQDLLAKKGNYFKLYNSQFEK